MRVRSSYMGCVDMKILYSREKDFAASKYEFLILIKLSLKAPQRKLQIITEPAADTIGLLRLFNSMNKSYKKLSGQRKHLLPESR